MTIDYERIGGAVLWRFLFEDAPGGVVMFHAANIRKRGDDDKAYVKLGIPGGRVVAADDLKLRDDGERGALANRAADGLWSVKYSDRKALALREAMLLFCDGLQEFWIGADSGAWIEGDESPSAPHWAVPGLIMVGSTTIHFGNAGANKSTIDRLLAQSLTCGVDTLFDVRKPQQAVWVNAEEAPEEHKRQLGNVNAALGLPRNTPLYTLDARGVGIAEIAPRLEKVIADTGAEHVFIDSLSRLAQGMNLNDNATATLLVDSIAGMGPSMNWVGHTGQENEHRLSGSKHFMNAARVMVRVQSRMALSGVSPELERGVRIQVTKANGAIEVEPQFFRFTYHRQYGLASAERSLEASWPMLRCDAQLPDGRGGERDCNRRTWDGVERGAHVRCSRHRDEEGD